MSFDVYVGPFTRYISGEWENAGQRAAREAGDDYQLIRDNMTEEAPPPPEEIRAIVDQWRGAISEALGEHLEHPLDWEESDEAPWFTDRPGWPGYAALLLLAAYDDHPDEQRPTELPEEWGDDPVYQRSAEDPEETQYPAILHADLWLPGDFDFMFGVEDLGGNDRRIASTEALLEELKELNEATFHGTQEDLDRWRAKAPPEDAPFDDQARFGLAVMLVMAENAVRTGLPLMPDY